MDSNSLNLFLAQGAPQGTPAGWTQMVPLLLMGAVMVFLFTSQSRKAKKQFAELMAKLKTGDRVATTSGIFGVVVSIKDTSVILRSVDTKFEVAKASIANITEASSEKADAKTES